MLNQETGVRGYLLSTQPSFLAPYTAGVANQAAQVKALRPLLVGLPAAQRDLADGPEPDHGLAVGLCRARHPRGKRRPASRRPARTTW